MAKKREKQQQLATLDSLSLSAVKREHVQMTQKRITKSRAGCPPATLPCSPPLQLPTKLLRSELGMELKMFWRVTTRGNGMQKFSTWVAFHSGSRWGSRKRGLGRRGYEQGRQGTALQCELVCRLLFCRTPPRHILSLSLSLCQRHSLCSASITNETDCFSWRTFLVFCVLTVYIVNTKYNKVFFPS